MTIFTRAATIAAMVCSLVGLATTSAPGRAADLDRPAVSAAVLVQPVNNTAPLISVPSPAAAAQPQADAASATVPEPEMANAKFASLDAALAAQDQASVTDAARCLAAAVYFEAKSEPVAGQLAVAQVILNRSKSGRFPPDVCGVVTQRGQFSFVHGGVLPTIDAGRAQYRTAMAVAKVALAAAWKSAAPTALFFNARHGASVGRVQVAAIGNHVFYR